MRKTFYTDSEFRHDAVLCFVVLDGLGGRWEFDTREDAGPLRAFVDANRDALWVAYSIAAEISSLLRLDITPPRDWIDLMPEAGAIITTHPKMRTVEVEREDEILHVNPRTPRLLSAMQHLCGWSADEDKKESTLELILSQTTYSDAEWREIIDYCASDTIQLVDLWRAIQTFHADNHSPWLLTDAIYRGRTTLNVTTMLHRSPGFRINEGWLSAIYEYRVPIIHAEIDRVGLIYRGYNLFDKTDTGGKVNFKECKRYAETNRIPWLLSERNATPIMREDYLSTFTKQAPELRQFKECRDLIIQLAKNRWTEGDEKKHQPPLIENGRVKAVSIPFYTKSGRSQPLVNRGHILNARPFIRTSIRPDPGRVIIGCDWSQQEIAIALRYFPDPALREAYESGDIYLALAIMAGAAPQGATKDTHDYERSQFKSVQLGLGYGMGADALGRKMFADLNSMSDTLLITQNEALDRAEEIFAWHKEEFSTYWELVDDFIQETIEDGFCLSEDRWLYFADEDSARTQLQNIKMQANGATMMHYALNALAKTPIDFLAEHHDAIYVECDEQDAHDVEFVLRDIMDSAAVATIGHDIKIKIDAKHYSHKSGYYDKRANRMVDQLNKHLEGLL